MTSLNTVNVLFVCMGNICRSPTAEGVFRELIAREGLTEKFVIDSAGTHSYHIGHQPDKRSQAAALQRGIDLSKIRSRCLNADDFIKFDYLLAMDNENYAIMLESCPKEHRNKLHLFLSFSENLSEKEVPDPYYGGEKGFEYVLDLIETASQDFLRQLKFR